MNTLPNDIQIRLACVQAAVNTVGNPNHVQTAREYYAFVMEGYDEKVEGDIVDVLTSIEPTETALMKTMKKGARKA